ncbi:MAG: hypothetical protein FWE96_02585 [Coriobacteriia bacterium]|nr:hypothetical protein [Coriobacteriia bacterium]
MGLGQRDGAGVSLFGETEGWGWGRGTGLVSHFLVRQRDGAGTEVGQRDGAGAEGRQPRPSVSLR